MLDPSAIGSSCSQFCFQANNILQFWLNSGIRSVQAQILNPFCVDPILYNPICADYFLFCILIHSLCAGYVQQTFLRKWNFVIKSMHCMQVSFWILSVQANFLNPLCVQTQLYNPSEEAQFCNPCCIAGAIYNTSYASSVLHSMLYWRCSIQFIRGGSILQSMQYWRCSTIHPMQFQFCNPCCTGAVQQRDPMQVQFCNLFMSYLWSIVQSNLYRSNSGFFLCVLFSIIHSIHFWFHNVYEQWWQSQRK